MKPSKLWFDLPEICSGPGYIEEGTIKIRIYEEGVITKLRMFFGDKELLTLVFRDSVKVAYNTTFTLDPLKLLAQAETFLSKAVQECLS